MECVKDDKQSCFELSTLMHIKTENNNDRVASSDGAKYYKTETVNGHKC
jgi:hypothetical protein